MEISLSFSDIMTAIQAVILFLGLGATVFTLFLQNKANKRLATLFQDFELLVSKGKKKPLKTIKL